MAQTHTSESRLKKKILRFLNDIIFHINIEETLTLDTFTKPISVKSPKLEEHMFAVIFCHRSSVTENKGEHIG